MIVYIIQDSKRRTVAVSTTKEGAEEVRRRLQLEIRGFDVTEWEVEDAHGGGACTSFFGQRVS